MVGKALGEGHYQNTGPHMRAGAVSPTCVWALGASWTESFATFFSTNCISNVLEPYYTLTFCSLK
jgi:hypothetical protein